MSCAEGERREAVFMSVRSPARPRHCARVCVRRSDSSHLMSTLPSSPAMLHDIETLQNFKWFYTKFNTLKCRR